MVPVPPTPAPVTPLDEALGELFRFSGDLAEEELFEEEDSKLLGLAPLVDEELGWKGEEEEASEEGITPAAAAAPEEGGKSVILDDPPGLNSSTWAPGVDDPPSEYPESLWW